MRYWVFGWDGYYAKGGINDLQDKCETEEEARKFVKRHGWDYAHIYDTETGNKIEIEE